MQETLTVMLTTGAGKRPEAVMVPARVGSVRLGELLGEGGGGAVFIGYDEALGRRVAVKVLHRQVGPQGPAVHQELVVGVRNAARIKHPNIVTVHTVEMIGDMPVIVMEYVDGLSLAQLLKRTGALSLPLGLFVMREVSSAVAALHEAGVIHRDIKPANILLDRDGVAHVCDFGLACARPSGGFGMETEQVGGSPLYMAPEVFEGQVSTHGDVYALGVMMYEILIGAAPFSAETVQELRALHAAGEAPLEPARRVALPENVTETLRRALHKQRFLRFKSAMHLLRAIEQCRPPEPRDDALHKQLAQMVLAAAPNAGPHTPPSGERSAALERHAMTTFDLVARKAQQKRERRDS